MYFNLDCCLVINRHPTSFHYNCSMFVICLVVHSYNKGKSENIIKKNIQREIVENSSNIDRDKIKNYRSIVIIETKQYLICRSKHDISRAHRKHEEENDTSKLDSTRTQKDTKEKDKHITDLQDKLR